MSEFTLSSVDIELESPKGSTRGAVTLKAVPREVAVRKAMFVCFGAWGMALLTLPIPIVHFIAPPLLLLLGPALAFGVFKMYNGATDVTDGGAACPDCGVAVTLGPCAERWPLDVICPGCQARLYASRIEV